MKAFLQFLVALYSVSVFAQSPSGQSSTTLKSDEDIDKPWSVSLFSLGGITNAQFDAGDPSMDFFDNFLTISYKINRDVTIGARPAFGYSTVGKSIYGDQMTNEIRSRDFSFVLKVKNLFSESLSPDVSMSNQFRLYLPSSDNSIDQGMIARLRSEFETKYRFNKYNNVRYWVKPSYYFQRSTVYIGFGGSVSTTPKIDLEHGGEVNFDINKYFAAKPGFEFQEKWSNSSVAENKDERRSSRVRTQFGIEYKPNRDMNFTLAINDTKDLIQPDRRNPELGTGWTLMTNVTMY